MRPIPPLFTLPSLAAPGMGQVAHRALNFLNGRSNSRPEKRSAGPTWDRRLPQSVAVLRCGQPVKAGAVRLTQRWKRSRIVFGAVPLSSTNVVRATSRWLPGLNAFGFTRRR